MEVVKRHVELKRAGTASWKGLCPFHAEKSPSFHVHETRQFFHCFGCGEKGDVFGFLTKTEGRSFMEVLRDLAGESGIDLGEAQLTDAEKRSIAEAESERERMMRALEDTTKFFEAQLLTPSGAQARAYLEKRGLTAQVATRFRIGFASASSAALEQHLSACRISDEVAERLGLVGNNERGRYAFFRDRVMLPVLDRQKRVVGFSGRLLDPDAKAAKYVNSPDSPVFHKKELLLGLPFALDPIRRAGHSIIVEGNFDVVTCHQAGIEEVVAPMGTALGAEHVAALGRLARRVVVIFDGDDAGQRAARKVLPLFVDLDLDGRVAQLPKGVDPDDFVRREGAAAFRSLVESARPMVEQFIDDLARQADPTIPGRVKAMDEGVEILIKVRNSTERELYAARLAAALKLDLPQVIRALRTARTGRAPGGQTQQGGPPDPAHAAVSDSGEPIVAPRIPARDELEVVVLLLGAPSLAALPEAARALALLTDVSVATLYRAALDALHGGGHADIPGWLSAGPSDIREAVARTLMEGRYDGMDEGDAARTLRSFVQRLERARLDAEIERVRRDQEIAQLRGDEVAARAMSQHLMELIRTKQGLGKKPN